MKFLILFLFSTSVLATEVVSITRSGIRTNPTNAREVQFLVAFSDRVQNVQISDFQLRATGNLFGGQIVDVFSTDDQSFRVVVRYFEGQGSLRLDLVDADRSILDHENRPLARSVFNTSQIWSIDNLGPRALSLFLTGTFPEGMNRFVDRYMLRFDEDVRNVGTYHFFASGVGVYIRSVYGSGSIRYIDVVKSNRYQNTFLRFSDPGRSVTDLLGNRRRL